MQDGLCYIQYNNDTIYGFPDLTCSDGDLLPEFTSTTRQIYRLFNGKYQLSQVSSINNYSSNYSSYIAHISTGMDRYSIDINFLVLPATLFVLALFSVIYHWFIRLRG